MLAADISPGSKLLTAYTLHYRQTVVEKEIRFQFITGKMREFHPGDKKWNNNGTIIRPGARYQVSQNRCFS